MRMQKQAPITAAEEFCTCAPITRAVVPNPPEWRTYVM